MTLDEAIKHYEQMVNMCQWGSGNRKLESEYKQLVKWLKELKEFKLREDDLK